MNTGFLCNSIDKSIEGEFNTTEDVYIQKNNGVPKDAQMCENELSRTAYFCRNCWSSEFKAFF